MKIRFGEKAVSTTVYVKLVGPDQLLLSETIFNFLGIVSYHPNVRSVERCLLAEETVSGVNASCPSTTGIEKDLNAGSSINRKQPVLVVKKETCEILSITTTILIKVQRT